MKQDFFKSRADISMLRTSATLAVLFWHTVCYITNRPDLHHLTQTQSICYHTLYHLMTWAIPVFFMISGALLLHADRKITYQICLKKYVKRFLLALILFGFIFACIELAATEKQFSLKTVGVGVYYVIVGKTWGHLWYLYVLIGIYLLLPLWKIFTGHCTRRELRYILIVLFVVNICFPVVQFMLDEPVRFETPIKSVHVFYFLLGKYLDDKTPDFLQNRKKNVSILLAVIALKALLTIFSMRYSIGIDTGRNSITTAAMAVLIFCSIKGCKAPINHAVLWNVDRLCFGVYLIHPLFIHFLYQYLRFTPLSFGGGWAVSLIGFWIFFAIASFGASWVMSLIKPLKKYIL